MAVFIIISYNLGGEGEVMEVHSDKSNCLLRIYELRKANESCSYGEDMQYDMQTFEVIK